MNITDKLYTEWAWRTKTGVPDINNPEDKAILDNIISELTNTDGEISKKEVIQAIQNGDFTPEQLKNILNGISGVAYKKDVLEYLSQQGKAIDTIKKYIYNELVENGDIQNYHTTIGNFPSYSSLGSSGNLYSLFSNKFSQETLKYLMDKKPAMGNIATGKGEIFLATLIDDVSSDSPDGDISAGGKGIEVKNKGAKPAGQKFQFGKNVDKIMVDSIVKEVNKLIDSPIPTGYRARPFHRIQLIINEALKQNPGLTDEILSIADNTINNVYPGIDLTGLSIKDYKKGNNFDANSFELAFVKRIVRAYIQTEGFEEILFLDDSSGDYVRVPSSKIENLVGNKITAVMKDGLPRWSYNF